jgi:hypothetical protein
LSPGNWVHDFGNTHVTIVHQIVTGRSMEEPDTIKEGWSVPKLWCLWWSFVVVSLVVSGLLTFLIWRPRKTDPAILSAVH